MKIEKHPSYYLDNWLLYTSWTSSRTNDLSSIDVNPWCGNSKDMPWNQEMCIPKVVIVILLPNRIIDYAIKNKMRFIKFLNTKKYN